MEDKELKQWEYKVVKAPRKPWPSPSWEPGSKEEEDFLNEQGALGWEFCFIYVGVMLYYFKRQVIENQ